MSFPRLKGVVLPIFLFASMSLFLVWSGCSSGAATRTEQTAMAAIPAQPTREQLKIDSLETENVNLKQKLVKLEQDNNTVNARLSDVEAKLKAEIDKAATPPQTAAVAVAPASPASYEGALKIFGEKKYDEAIQMFQALLDGGIPEDIADNCHYWIGESFFGKKQYKEAIKHFEMVLQSKNFREEGGCLLHDGAVLRNARRQGKGERIVRESREGLSDGQ